MTVGSGLLQQLGASGHALGTILLVMTPLSIRFLNVHLFFGSESDTDIDRHALETAAIAKWADARNRSKYTGARELLAADVGGSGAEVGTVAAPEMFANTKRPRMSAAPSFVAVKPRSILAIVIQCMADRRPSQCQGAGGESRTPTGLRPADCEYAASTSSATPAPYSGTWCSWLLRRDLTRCDAAGADKLVVS